MSQVTVDFEEVRRPATELFPDQGNTGQWDGSYKPPDSLGDRPNAGPKSRSNSSPAPDWPKIDANSFPISSSQTG